MSLRQGWRSQSALPFNPPSRAPDFSLIDPHAIATGTAKSPRIVIIGGGPAGLMAAEVLASLGAPLRIELYDAMPSVGRKFLLAGKEIGRAHV